MLWREPFNGDEDLASQYIPRSIEHTRNSKKRIESGERIAEHQINCRRDRLKEFLKDFKIGEPGLSAATKAKKEATKRSWIGINVAIVGIILALAGLVVGIIGIKGCSDSSQRPAQPVAERRSVANNQTP